MASASDRWFVRFPDGRVVLAKSTRAVRHHIAAGRIPGNSRVRRSPDEEWQKLERLTEFAEVLGHAMREENGVQESESAAMGRSVDFRTLGVGGLVSELLNAVDSSLQRTKLWIAGITALVWAVGILAMTELLPRLVHAWWLWGYRAVVGVALLFVGGVASSLLGQMALVEMSRLRPAEWREVRPGLFGKAIKIMMAQGLVLAVILVPILALGRLENTPLWIQGAGLALRLVLEIIFWPLVGMALLLPPLILVEESTLPRAMLQWLDLLRTDLSRIILYETLAVGLGAALTFPLVFPILYVSWTLGALDSFLSAVALATLYVLGGLATAPLVAFLLVANVFIYLNLRYEFLFPASR